MMKDRVRFFQLPREKIVEFIFLLEGYEGLGIVRTLDRERGIIEVLLSAELEPEFNQWLENLPEELNIKEIPKPEEVKSLLDDYLQEKTRS